MYQIHWRTVEFSPRYLLILGDGGWHLEISNPENFLNFATEEDARAKIAELWNRDQVEIVAVGKK